MGDGFKERLGAEAREKKAPWRGDAASGSDTVNPFDTRASGAGSAQRTCMCWVGCEKRRGQHHPHPHFPHPQQAPILLQGVRDELAGRASTPTHRHPLHFQHCSFPSSCCASLPSRCRPQTYQLLGTTSAGRGSTTMVGISSIRSSALPECSRRVKPPISQGPSLSHLCFCFLYL